MRINYRILWFEDNATSYKTKKGFVKDIVEDFGFNFIEPQNELDGSNVDTINFANYDLIIADMTLAGGVTAMSLMDPIRKRNVFTEVLFYSSNGEDAVRAELAKYRIDGAYCSDRNNDDFEYKAKEVIRTLIKKTQDLTNMRGLVMAETSELDKIMVEILQLYFVEKKSDDSDRIFKEILKEIEKSHKGRLEKSDNCDKKCTHKIVNEEISLVIRAREFDSSKKSYAINKIISKNGFKYESKSNFYEDFKEVSSLRNELAHCYSDERDDEEVLITRNGEVEKIFKDEDFKQIRQDILKYANILTDLKGFINV